MNKRLISFRQLKRLCGYKIPRQTCNDVLCNLEASWRQCDKDECPMWKRLKKESK